MLTLIIWFMYPNFTTVQNLSKSIKLFSSDTLSMQSDISSPFTKYAGTVPAAMGILTFW